MKVQRIMGEEIFIDEAGCFWYAMEDETIMGPYRSFSECKEALKRYCRTLEIYQWEEHNV